MRTVYTMRWIYLEKWAKYHLVERSYVFKSLLHARCGRVYSGATRPNIRDNSGGVSSFDNEVCEKCLDLITTSDQAINLIPMPK